MAKDFAKLSFKEKCRRQDRAFMARNLYPTFFIFAIFFAFIIPFFLVAEMVKYASNGDMSKIPTQVVSYTGSNLLVSFVVAAILLVIGIVTLIIHFYYKIPQNISIALALTRIDNIKSKCSKRMTDPECKNIHKPYNIIQSINFRTLSPYAKNREGLLKFKKMFKKYISRIMIYCEPNCYSSIRNDLHKIIESFERERYGDIRGLNESIWKEISGMDELKKLIKPNLFERTLSHLLHANAERIDNAFDLIWNYVRKITLIASAILSVIIYSSFIWNPDLFNKVLSNPTIFIATSAPIGVYSLYVGIKVIIKR